MTLHNRLKWMGRDRGGTGSTTSGHSFGKGIEPCNLRLCEHGATHVSMAGDWAGIAQGLHGLGDVVATTLNDAAILSQRGRFPRFDLCPGGRFAVNGHGGLAFDFAEWRRLWATRRPTNKGACQSLAIVGHDNRAAHQVLLTETDKSGAFAEFTRQYQGSPKDHGTWPARGAGVCVGYHERFRCRKWEFVEDASNGARHLSSGCIEGLFEAVLANHWRLATTIVSAPVIQSALWTPAALEHCEQRITVTSDQVQLRLEPRAAAEVWAVPSPDVDDYVAVELYDVEDRLLLGLSVAPEFGAAWNGFVRTLPSS